MALLRNLTTLEIVQLQRQGCTAENWCLIKVRDHFSADTVINVQFSGRIEMGCMDGVFSQVGGFQKPCGIYRSTLHNCIIGNNCRIADATIASYTIGNNCLVEQVGGIYTDSHSSFGNGVEVEVLNEAGGREVMLYDGLSAQTAYIQAFYRHRPDTIKKLKALITQYSESVSSEMGTIGNDTRIVRCRLLKNIRVGASATVAGATRLENGTILSTPEAPTRIGDGVMAHNFIVAEGAAVRSGAMISNSYVGQSVELARQFSAVNSIFFSYSHCEHGEACSAFAGPFTVTHHKSTLLIAGYFSFMNAGSGTNQSNHLYRLGPAHQGILERGCKTGSNSYILWPSRVGAFSLVIGKHTHNADTSELPFSYLLENKQETYLLPGATLGNVGTIRDAQKWQKRNVMKGEIRTDMINCDLFTPYILGKILQAIEILKELKSKPADLYHYKGVRIKSSALETGIALYENAIHKHLGDCLLSRLENADFSSLMDVKHLLKPENEEGLGKWVDLAGLIAPQNKVDAILDQIDSNAFESPDSTNKAWKALHQEYDQLNWVWIIDKLEQQLGKKVAVWTTSDLIQIIEKCLEAVLEFNRQLLEDARKEFAPEIRTGYGIDGDQEIIDADFEAVRGDFEQHPVIVTLRDHSEKKKLISVSIIEKLKRL